MERASPDGPMDWPGRLRSRLTNRSPDQDRPFMEKDAGEPYPKGPDPRARRPTEGGWTLGLGGAWRRRGLAQ